MPLHQRAAAAAAVLSAAGAAAAGGSPLRPQASETREVVELSGAPWRVRADPTDAGARGAGWQSAPLPPPTAYAPVPATLNELLAADPAANWTDGYFGAVWYEREFFAPAAWRGSAVALRFDGATYRADAWLNGASLGGHEGIGLPFELAASDAVRLGAANRLTVRVDGRRSWQSVPPGRQEVDRWGRGVLYGGDAGYLYSTPGIDQRVWLTRSPPQRIADINVTTLSAAAGVARVAVSLRCDPDCAGVDVEWTLANGTAAAGAVVARASGAAAVLTVPGPRLWWPGGVRGGPFLYTLRAALRAPAPRGGGGEGALADAYRLSVGLRTVETRGTAVLINGEPHYWRGVDYHLGAPLRGHGVDGVVFARDVALMRSLGMNGFRLNSWPVPEELLDLCDRAGLVVQQEVAGIALRGSWDPACPAPIYAPAGHCANATTRAAHARALTSLVARDKNRASVVSWSVANEPDVGEDGAVPYFAALLAAAKAADPARRPVTLEADMPISDPAAAAAFYAAVPFDFVSVHNYPGWYDFAPLPEVEGVMAAWIAAWAAAVPGKPLFVSEYGAGAVPGTHQTPPVQFTEEYQVEVLKADHRAFDRFRGPGGPLAGEHVHAFADFKQAGASNTQPHAGRSMLNDVLGLNYKGLFSRERQPKAAAALIRERYLRIAAGGGGRRRGGAEEL